jgi:hypothetical protein
MTYLESMSGNQETARGWFEKSLFGEATDQKLALPTPEPASAT